MACRIVLVTEPSVDAEELCRALAAKGREVIRLDMREIEACRPAPHDIVLAAGTHAVETCERLLRRDPRCALVVLDDEPSVDRAVAALRAGAADFVTDPADTDA